MEKKQAESDEKLKEAMQREVKKGMIVFNAPQANPLVQRAKAINMDAETRAKLAHKRIVEL